MDLKLFGKNLKYLRRRRGMSQQDLAELFGKSSYSTVSKWESAEIEPPVNVVKGMAELFGVSMDDLIAVDLQDSPTRYIDQSKGIPDITPEALQIALAYDRANEHKRIVVEGILGIDFKKGSAGAVSSGSEHSSKSIEKEETA